MKRLTYLFSTFIITSLLLLSGYSDARAQNCSVGSSIGEEDGKITFGSYTGCDGTYDIWMTKEWQISSGYVGYHSGTLYDYAHTNTFYSMNTIPDIFGPNSYVVMDAKHEVGPYVVYWSSDDYWTN